MERQEGRIRRLDGYNAILISTIVDKEDNDNGNRKAIMLF